MPNLLGKRRASKMTRAELAALTARAERIERIIRALQAFEDCEHDHEHAAAERELKAALESEPKIVLTGDRTGA
jgi:phosphopantetheine adenylyltransferase